MSMAKIIHVSFCNWYAAWVLIGMLQQIYQLLLFTEQNQLPLEIISSVPIHRINTLAGGQLREDTVDNFLH